MKTLKTLEELNSLSEQFEIVDLPENPTKETIIKIKCKKCNQTFEKKLYYFCRNHSKCPNCGFKILLKDVTKDYLNSLSEQFEVVGEIPEIKNRDTIIKIKCNKCGKIFEKSIWNFLRSHKSCPLCQPDECHYKKTTERFIEQARKVHGNKYGRDFEVAPNRHINALIGCPYCHGSRGEREIRTILEEKNIDFEEQKSFPDCKDQLPLSYDFYIPSTKTLIEYQGEQHYKKVYYGGENHSSTNFEIQKTHDKIKADYAKNNGYKLITIPYTDLGKIKEKYFK